MYLTHCNDGKEKWQSHEIEFNEDNFADYKRMIFGLDPTSITGYGSTKEEAFKDFKEKFCRVNDIKFFFANKTDNTNFCKRRI